MESSSRAHHASHNLQDYPSDLSKSFETLPSISTENSITPPPNSNSNESSSSVLIITASYDHTIRFWDVLQGTCLATLQHNESQVNAMTISPDKKYLAVAGNSNVRLFDIDETLTMALSSQSDQIQDFSASTANIQAKNILQGHRSNVTSVSFQSSGNWLFTASTDGSIKIWDLPGLKCQREFFNKSSINGAVLHPNQVEIIMGDESGFVKVLDLTKGTGTFSVSLCPEESVPITSVAISEDGEYLAIVNENGNLFIWRSQSSESASAGFTPFGRICDISRPPFITKCLFSPNSQLLVTLGSDSQVKIWSIHSDSQSVKLASTLSGHSNWIWDAAFSADCSFILTGASDNTARLWDVTTGEMICIYSGHSKAISAVAMNDSILTSTQSQSCE